MLQDFFYALRMLRKNPGMTAVVVLSLAVGIGANSAIFSVVDALLLRPLPYSQPERLANIWLHSPGIGIFRDWPSPGQFVDIQRENHSFDELAIARLSRDADIADILILRRADERAKDPNANVPGLEDWRPALENQIMQSEPEPDDDW